MVKIPLSLIETSIGAAGAVAASIIANKSSSEKSHSQSKKIVKPFKMEKKVSDFMNISELISEGIKSILDNIPDRPSNTNSKSPRYTQAQ